METKPRFKNSFGVTGTKGEIAHFKELADSIGWIKDSTLCNKSLVWFESSLSKISSLSGKYWSPIKLKSPISLSTPEGWQRALSLAEEKEEEVPEYYEAITSATNLTKGKIYKFVKMCPRQELLEEAKRRYPVGTKYKSVPEGHMAIVRGDFIYLSNAITDGWGGVVYHNEQWAEIIPEEKAPTKEEIERVLNYLKEITK